MKLQNLVLLCCVNFIATFFVACGEPDKDLALQANKKINEWCTQEKVDALYELMRDQIKEAVLDYVMPFRWSVLHYRMSVTDIRRLLRRNNLPSGKWLWQSNAQYVAKNKKLLLATWIQRQTAQADAFLDYNQREVIYDMLKVGAHTVQISLQERFILRGIQSVSSLRERQLHLVLRAYDAGKNLIMLSSLNGAFADHISCIVSDSVKL